MNVYLNKDFLKFKKINNRYLKFNDKPEKQTGISDNFNIFNKSNLTKSNNIYNSNFFSVNKIGNFNDIIKSRNNIKKENSLRLNPILIKNKNEKAKENLNLHATNFKNAKSNSKIIIKGREILNAEKEENKYNIDNNIDNNIFKTNDSTPTILKIQKLIEALQTKHTTDNSNNNINFKNDEKYDNNISFKKKNDKLPSLINDIKANFKPEKNEINDQLLLPVKDIINTRTNHTKIKLKTINPDTHLIIKSINKSRDEKNNVHNIKIKAKDLPKEIPRKPKVSLDQIKNIIKNDLIINNNGSYEKIVNIRLKSDNTRKYFNASAYQENSYSQMKSQKESANFCLSNYNSFKNNLMILKQTFHNFENERKRKEKFFNKNQTMFGNPLNEKKFKEENEDESDEDNQKRFSKYFLPSSGFGLLQRHDN